MKKLSEEVYVIMALAASLLGNGFLLYKSLEFEYPRASYISWVGVDKSGRCVTGQEFLNYDPDSKQEIMNTIMAQEFFTGVKKIVLVNKWSIKNDMSEPPEVRLVQR